MAGNYHQNGPVPELVDLYTVVVAPSRFGGRMYFLLLLTSLQGITYLVDVRKAVSNADRKITLGFPTHKHLYGDLLTSFAGDGPGVTVLHSEMPTD